MQPSELAPSIYAMADVNVVPLATNIYRTALPSKTATCIACQKPIIFCIGNDSKFGRLMSSEPGFYVLGSCEADKLVDTIKELKNNRAITDNSILYKKAFSRTANSKHYAELIVGGRL